MLRRLINLGKRSKPTKPPLRASQSTASNARPQVFSYYSSRRTQEMQAPGRRIASPEATAATRPARKVGFRQIPTLAAIALLGLCALFSTTLSSTPKVRVCMANGDQTIIYRPAEAYQQAADAAMADSIFNKSKLTLQRDEITRSITEALPEVRSIRLATPLISRNLVMTIQTDSVGIGLRTLGGAYLLDSSGTVINELSDAPSVDGLAMVQDETGTTVEVGKPALSNQEVTFISQLAAQLAAQKLPPATMVLPAGIANELHVRFEGQPYYVKYALTSDVRKQTGAYLAVKADLDGKGRPPAEYIDVRVEGRAYIR